MGIKMEFATASHVIFGNYSVEKVPGIIREKGRRILLVTGKNTNRAKPLTEILPPEIEVTFFQVISEPTIWVINQGIQLARANECEVIVGFGGGSVIDAAKAIAALVPNKGELMDYLEVIGLGKPLFESPLLYIAIPTTAGTGAEVTKNAVIKSLEHKVKVSLRSPFMFPDYAVVDPVLTWSMSPELTAFTGVDALTHLMETFVSVQANPYIDLFCEDGMKRVSRSLKKAYQNGNDGEAREDLSMASMLGGMALANVKLGAVHGFAGPIGGMFPIPHGAVCAGLISAVMKTNIEALKKQNRSLSKYDKVAQILTGSKLAKAKDGINWVKNLTGELKIPSLSEFGISEIHFNELVEKAKNASSMKGNPLILNDWQLKQILVQSLQEQFL